MWWKIYYWVFVFIAVASVATLFTRSNSLIDLVLGVHTVLVVVGIHAYIYKKRLLNPTFWLYFFWFSVVYDIATLAYLLAPNDPILKNLSFLIGAGDASYPQGVLTLTVFLVTLLAIPMLYVFYQLGHPRKK